jgi:hypothetical protein
MRTPDLFHQPKQQDSETKTLKILSKYNVRLLLHDGSTGYKGDSNFYALYKNIKERIKLSLKPNF